MLLIVGLMFGCGGDDAATDDGHDYVHGEEDSSEFEAAADNLGVVFDDPVAAGRPSPSFSADISPILTNRCASQGATSPEDRTVLISVPMTASKRAEKMGLSLL